MMCAPPPDANRCAVKALKAVQASYGGYDFEYWEVTGRGHRGPPGGNEVLFDKIANKLRVARPSRVIWQPSLSWKRDFYWLHWDQPVRNAVLVATLDRDKNEVHIQPAAASTKGLCLWLDGATLDFSSTVSVFVNKKQVWSGVPTPTLQSLLRSTERGDRGHIYPVYIQLDP